MSTTKLLVFCLAFLHGVAFFGMSLLIQFGSLQFSSTSIEGQLGWPFGVEITLTERTWWIVTSDSLAIILLRFAANLVFFAIPFFALNVLYKQRFQFGTRMLLIAPLCLVGLYFLVHSSNIVTQQAIAIEFARTGNVSNSNFSKILEFFIAYLSLAVVLAAWSKMRSWWADPAQGTRR